MEDRYDKHAADTSDSGVNPERNAPEDRPAVQEKKPEAKRLSSGHDALLPVSVVGGLVGMLIGTLPAAFCALLFGRSFSPLYVFLPLFIYLGIKLFRGYDGKRGLIVVAVFSVVGFYLTLLSCQAAVYVDRYQMLFLNIPLVTIMLIGKAGVLRGPAISSAYIFPFVFALLGVFLSEEFLMRKKEHVPPPEPHEEAEYE